MIASHPGMRLQKEVVGDSNKTLFVFIPDNNAEEGILEDLVRVLDGNMVNISSARIKGSPQENRIIDESSKGTIVIRKFGK